MKNFDRYANVIESMIRRYPESLWRDLRQECAVAFFEIKSRDDLEIRDFYVYAVKSMYHAVRDFVVNESINSHLSLDQLAFEEENDRVTFADLIEEPAVLMDAIIAKDFIEKWDIPERDMKILRLYYVEGYTPTEMSDDGLVDLSKSQIYNIISSYQ